MLRYGDWGCSGCMARGWHLWDDHRDVSLGCCPDPVPVPLDCLCAQVVDLLVAMCRAALESPRKSIIFEPYPSVVDPNDPKTLAFNPKVSSGAAVGQRSPLPGLENPSDGHPSAAPCAEEELRAAAEGPGQRDVHPGDDPGMRCGPSPTFWPCVRLFPLVISIGWHFGALHKWVGG